MEYNETNSNVRTLIVSFVVAVFALIPLRFYEASELGFSGGAQVLGARQEIVLPEVYEGDVSPMMLEAPYNEIEFGTSEEVQVLGEETIANSCLSVAEANNLLEEATSLNFTEEEIDMLIMELSAMQMCE